MPSCFKLPHGGYSLVPAVLTTMGWLAGLFQDGCDYSRLTGDIVEQLATNGAPWVEVGYAAYREPKLNTEEGTYEVAYTGACERYPEDVVEQDAYWKASKGFAFLALVLGGAGTFFLWFSTCCVFSRGTWRLVGYEVLLAAFFQALSFLWFKTAMCQENTCSLFWGSKTDIVATSLWATAALCIFCYYPKPKDMVEADGLVRAESENASRPSVSVGSGHLSLVEPTVTTAGVVETHNTGDEDGSSQMSSGQDSRQDGKNKDLSDAELI